MLDQQTVLFAKPGKIKNALTHEGAAQTVEIATGRIDHFLQIERKRPIGAHVDAS